MSKKNLCLFASVLVGISAFLPYISVSFLGSSLSKSLFDGGDGIFIIIIAAIALICSLSEKYVPVILMGAASFVLFFVENSSVTSSLSKADRASAAIAKSMIQNGAGYYCLLIGSIALILFGYLANNEKKAG